MEVLVPDPFKSFKSMISELEWVLEDLKNGTLNPQNNHYTLKPALIRRMVCYLQLGL